MNLTMSFSIWWWWVQKMMMLKHILEHGAWFRGQMITQFDDKNSYDMGVHTWLWRWEERWEGDDGMKIERMTPPFLVLFMGIHSRSTWEITWYTLSLHTPFSHQTGILIPLYCLLLVVLLMTYWREGKLCYPRSHFELWEEGPGGGGRREGFFFSYPNPIFSKKGQTHTSKHPSQRTG